MRVGFAIRVAEVNSVRVGFAIRSAEVNSVRVAQAIRSAEVFALSVVKLFLGNCIAVITLQIKRVVKSFAVMYITKCRSVFFCSYPYKCFAADAYKGGNIVGLYAIHYRGVVCYKPLVALAGFFAADGQCIILCVD